MRILLAIPTYRCAPQIQRVIAKLSENSLLRERIECVLIVDNQSPDNTVQSAIQEIADRGCQNWIWVTRNQSNFGLGGTHKLVFNWAKDQGFDGVVLFHGDDQAEVVQIHDILDRLETGREAALGSRFMRLSQRNGYSKIRTVGNVILNAIYSMLLLRPVRDLGSGLNGFKLSAIDFEALPDFSNQFTFNMDLLINLFQRKRNVVFVPITWNEKDQRSNAKTIEVGWKALMTVVLWRLGWKRQQIPSGADTFERVA